MITSGLNQSQLRENNLEIVIRAIQADRSSSRASIAQQTGLKRSTITKIVNQLIDWNIVAESDTMERNKGRKPTRLLLNGERCHVLAASINRHMLRVSICDLTGALTHVESHPLTRREEPRQVMATFKAMIQKTLAQSPWKIHGIGVAVPGLYNPARKRITMMSGFPGWENFDIERELEGTSPLPIYIEQNVNCGAFAELWFGKETERYNNMLFISSDRGLGAALVRNGEIFRGSNGSFGEVGHMSINLFGPKCECGSRGCLEMYASPKALERTYMEESFKAQGGAQDSLEADLKVEDICALVRRGDPVAVAAYDQVVRYLAFGLVSIIHTLDPKLIVFATKLSLAGDRMLDIIQSSLSRHMLPARLENVQFAISDVQEDLDIRGSAALCFLELFKQPSLIFDQGFALDP